MHTLGILSFKLRGVSESRDRDKEHGQREDHDCCVCGSVLPAAFSAQPQMGYRAVADEELSSAVNYWTPARMAAAIPRDLLDASTAGSQPTQVHAPTARVSAPSADPSAEGPALSLGADGREEESGIQPTQFSTYPYPFTRYFTPNGWKNTFSYKAVGKLFFSIGGSGFVCSASVIRPHLLLTARHCIFDYASGQWATNMTFYPGYTAGASNPTQGGAWFAGIGHVDFQRIHVRLDIGFIQTFRKNGGNCAPDSSHRQIESYTGYLGYSYGGDFNQKHWDDFGYPQAAPFNGKSLVQCEAGTGAVNVFGFNNTVEWGCDTTGGTSGGPALIGFVPESPAPRTLPIH